MDIVCLLNGLESRLRRLISVISGLNDSSKHLISKLVSLYGALVIGTLRFPVQSNVHYYSMGTTTTLASPSKKLTLAIWTQDFIATHV